MDSIIPKNYTRMLAEDQPEYNNLAIIDAPIDLEGHKVNCMYSYWKPSPEDLIMLNNGAPLC